MVVGSKKGRADGVVNMGVAVVKFVFVVCFWD